MTSIIIVTYNSEKTIKVLVKSIKALVKAEHEIIIIDNASTDATIKQLQEFNNIQVLTQTKNLGFAAACHIGVKHSKGNVLLFLNPDVVLLEDSISKLEPFFKNPQIGVIGCKIVDTTGNVQHSVRSFPTLLSQVLIFFKVHHLFTNIKSLRAYFLPNFDYELEQAVDQVMGAMFYTRKSLWEQLGGFDTRFFIWFEEVDYCFQTHALGYSVIYTPTSTIRHIGGHSFSQVSVIRKQLWYFSSMVKYFLKRVTS